MNPAVTIAIVACVFVIAVLAGVLLALQRSKAAAAAEDAALDAAERRPAAQATPGPELVGFGPQTSSLPLITQEMLQSGGSAQAPGGTTEDPEIFGQRSFGFFGAVTSAISIVPQVDRLPGSPGSNDER